MKTIKEIAQEWKVSKRTVTRWIKEGVVVEDFEIVKLKATVIGGVTRITEEDYREFLNKIKGGQ